MKRKAHSNFLKKNLIKRKVHSISSKNTLFRAWKSDIEVSSKTSSKTLLDDRHNASLQTSGTSNAPNHEVDILNSLRAQIAPKSRVLSFGRFPTTDTGPFYSSMVEALNDTARLRAQLHHPMTIIPRAFSKAPKTQIIPVHNWAQRFRARVFHNILIIRIYK